MRYLIAYDIADRNRRQRVHHHMQQYGQALQCSVYLFEGHVIRRWNAASKD